MLYKHVITLPSKLKVFKDQFIQFIPFKVHVKETDVFPLFVSLLRIFGTFPKGRAVCWPQADQRRG